MAKPKIAGPNSNPWKSAMQRMPGTTAQGRDIPDDLLEFAPDYIKRGVYSQRGADPVGDLRGQGFRVQGNVATRNVNGIPYQYPLSSLIGNAGNASGLAGFENVPPTLVDALFGDTQMMQAAADEQFGRNNAASGAFLNTLQGSSQDVQQGGMAGANRLRGLGDQMQQQAGLDFNSVASLLEGLSDNIDGAADAGRRGMTQAQGDIGNAVRFGMSAVSSANANVNADIEEAYRLGDEAVAKWEQDIKNRVDTTAQDAALISDAIYTNAARMKEQIKANYGNQNGRINPQMEEELMNLELQTGAETQRGIVPLLSRFNEVLAGLNQNLATLRMGNAGMRLTGAGLRQQGASLGLQAAGLGIEGGKAKAQIEAEKFGMERDAAGVRLGEADAQMRNQSGAREFASLVSNLYQAGEQIAQAAILDTARMRIEGMNAYADMIAANPRSVVSWFQGLLAMFSASQAMAPEPSFRGPSGSSGKDKDQAPQAPQQQPQQAQQPRPNRSVNNQGLTGYNRRTDVARNNANLLRTERNAASLNQRETQRYNEKKQRDSERYKASRNTGRSSYN
jgi:hypothetical protein